MSEKNEAQRRLQEMLTGIREQLDAVVEYATENNLCFQFDGVRRGPVEDEDEGGGISNQYIDANDPNVANEYGCCPIKVTGLDFNLDWIGSTC